MRKRSSAEAFCWWLPGSGPPSGVLSPRGFASLARPRGDAHINAIKRGTRFSRLRGYRLIERGRPDIALARIEQAWPAWRGRAVEPIIRDSLLRLLPDTGWPQSAAVGGWWNRQNNPEIDLVGADRYPGTSQVHFVGSIKWHDNKPFTAQDYESLARDVLAIPGATPTTPLVAVSRTRFADGLPLAAKWGPEDMLRAWQEPVASSRD